MALRASLKTIGYIATPYRALEECPRNIDPQGPPCLLVVDEELRDGLMGLRPGQPILILYWFERVEYGPLQRHSRRSGELKGIFALRTPHRPNPIGAAILTIERIEGATLVVRGLDCLDGTPLLDIKPAMAAECDEAARTGAAIPTERQDS